MLLTQYHCGDSLIIGWHFVTVNTIALHGYQECRETLQRSRCLTCFWLPHFCGKGAPMGLTMVLLGWVMICFHMLSIQTTIVSGIVWPQFVMQVLTKGCEPPVLGKGLETPVVTSYRLPTVTTGMLLTVFAVLRVVADRLNRFGWAERWHRALKCISCQKQNKQ